MTSRTAIKWVASLAIGGFFIWLSAKDGRFDRLAELGVRWEGTRLLGGQLSAAAISSHSTGPELLAEVNQRPGWVFELSYILWYLLVLSVIHVIRVMRWRPLLAPFAHVPFRTLNRVGAVGFMCTFLFPLRLGEFVRPYLLNRERPELPMSKVLATIVVERLIDGLLVSLVLFFVLLSLPQSEGANELRIAAYTALSVFIGALTFLCALYWQRDRTVRLVRAMVGRFSERLAKRVLSIIGTFIEGLSVLPNLGPVLAFVGLTTVYWLLNGFGLWLFARGFALDIPLELAYAMMSCVVMGMMIPNSPGNVGSFWYFLLLPLGLYSIGSEVPQVTVFGLAVYALQLIQQTAFGLWFLVTGKVRAQSLVDASHPDMQSAG